MTNKFQFDKLVSSLMGRFWSDQMLLRVSNLVRCFLQMINIHNTEYKSEYKRDILVEMKRNKEHI